MADDKTVIYFFSIHLNLSNKMYTFTVTIERVIWFKRFIHCYYFFLSLFIIGEDTGCCKIVKKKTTRSRV